MKIIENSTAKPLPSTTTRKVVLNNLKQVANDLQSEENILNSKAESQKQRFQGMNYSFKSIESPRQNPCQKR
jgi:hypothetical protein